MSKRFSVVVLISIIFSYAFTTNSFADMKSLIIPQGICSIVAYDAKIVGVNLKSIQEITIITTANDKNQSRINKAAITFTDKDIPLGLVLASSVGKNIRVFFPGNPGQCNVQDISIKTDDYWDLP